MLLLSAGCQHLNGIAPVDDARPTAEEGILLIDIENYEYLNFDTVSSRTIFGTVAQPVHLFLYGVAKDGSTLSKTAVTPEISDTHTGSAQIAVPKKNWTLLTLAAFVHPEDAPENINLSDPDSKAVLYNKAILIGSTSVNWSRWDTPARFILTTDGLTTPATLVLPVMFDGFSVAGQDFEITAALYAVTDNLLIENTSQDFSLICNSGASSFACEFNDITPGYYNFKVTFEKDDKYFIYPEIIQVLPGNTNTYDTVNIMNILGAAYTTGAGGS